MLDLFFVSDSDKVLLFNQISPLSTIDHDLLFICYDFDIRGESRFCYSYRDFRGVNGGELCGECCGLPWDVVFDCTSAEDQVEIFSSLIRYLFEKYVPIRTKWIRRDTCPWFSAEISSLIAEREYLYRRFRRIRTSEARLLYKVARNKVTLAIRNARRSYHITKFNTNLHPKILWRNLRQAGVYGSEHGSCALNPDELNSFFSSSNDSSVGAQQSHFKFHDNHSSLTRHTDAFYFRGISLEELITAIYSVKSDATGHDSLSPRFIKLLLPLIDKYILHIINTCLTTSSFPEAWRHAIVLPIPKKTISEVPSDFRPISILNFLSKVLEKVVSKQILDYLDDKQLLTPLQSGFRSRHSCETAVLRVSTDLRVALNDNMFSALVLLDFSKAFDSVDHNILLQKLDIDYRFSLPAAVLIREYLSGRYQQVKVDNILSSPLPILCGVPQGSVLGPLLFSLFINDLPKVVEDVSIQMYADDVQIYLSRPIGLLEDCIVRVNDDLERIHDWSNRNRLVLNPSKSQCIMFYNSTLNEIAVPPINLNGYVLPVQTKITDLGIILNSKMKCCDYVNLIIARVYAGLRRLWLSAYILPTSLRMKLVKTLIMPYFTFGSAVFPKLDSLCMRKVEVAFNDCIRFIFGLRRFDHVSSYRCIMLGCSLSSYLKQRILILLFNILNNNGPEYLKELFHLSRSNRNRNVIIPQFRRSVMEDSFLVQAARLWNGIPVHVRSARNVNAFKKLIRTHVP